MKKLIRRKLWDGCCWWSLKSHAVEWSTATSTTACYEVNSGFAKFSKLGSVRVANNTVFLSVVVLQRQKAFQVHDRMGMC